MESQPQNTEFRINPENFHPCLGDVIFSLELNFECFVRFIKLTLLVITMSG